MCFGNIIYGGKHDRYKAYLGVFKIYSNNIFYFLKIIFKINASK